MNDSEILKQVRGSVGKALAKVASPGAPAEIAQQLATLAAQVAQSGTPTVEQAQQLDALCDELCSYLGAPDIDDSSVGQLSMGTAMTGDMGTLKSSDEVIKYASAQIGKAAKESARKAHARLYMVAKALAKSTVKVGKLAVPVYRDPAILLPTGPEQVDAVGASAPDGTNSVMENDSTKDSGPAGKPDAQGAVAAAVGGEQKTTKPVEAADRPNRVVAENDTTGDNSPAGKATTTSTVDAVAAGTRPDKSLAENDVPDSGKGVIGTQGAAITGITKALEELDQQAGAASGFGGWGMDLNDRAARKARAARAASGR